MALNWSRTVNGFDHKFGNRDGVCYWTIFARISTTWILEIADSTITEKSRRKSAESSQLPMAGKSRIADAFFLWAEWRGKDFRFEGDQDFFIFGFDFAPSSVRGVRGGGQRSRGKRGNCGLPLTAN